MPDDRRDQGKRRLASGSSSSSSSSSTSSYYSRWAPEGYIPTPPTSPYSFQKKKAASTQKKGSLDDDGDDPRAPATGESSQPDHEEEEHGSDGTWTVATVPRPSGSSTSALDPSSVSLLRRAGVLASEAAPPRSSSEPSLPPEVTDDGSSPSRSPSPTRERADPHPTSGSPPKSSTTTQGALASCRPIVHRGAQPSSDDEPAQPFTVVDVSQNARHDGGPTEARQLGARPAPSTGPIEPRSDDESVRSLLDRLASLWSDASRASARSHDECLELKRELRDARATFERDRVEWSKERDDLVKAVNEARHAMASQYSREELLDLKTTAGVEECRERYEGVAEWIEWKMGQARDPRISQSGIPVLASPNPRLREGALESDLSDARWTIQRLERELYEARVLIEQIMEGPGLDESPLRPHQGS
ncbi:hypothetical protein JCM10212_003767 [Sporobolomyces blumeae]